MLRAFKTCARNSSKSCRWLAPQQEASSRISIFIPSLSATASVDESSSGVDYLAVQPVNSAYLN